MIKRLICWLFGHDLKVIKKLSIQCEKLFCIRCRRYFAINHNVRAFLPYDDVKELYEGFFAEDFREVSK